MILVQFFSLDNFRRGVSFRFGFVCTIVRRNEFEGGRRGGKGVFFLARGEKSVVCGSEGAIWVYEL